jgi:hypothetical protein
MLKPALRLGLAQTVLALIVAGVAYRMSGQAAAQGAFYGGCVALGSTLLMVWRHRQGAQQDAEAGQEAGYVMRALYRSSVERFVFVGLLLAVGLGGLGMHPAGTIVGFVVAQLGWLALPFMQGPDTL